MFLRGNNISGVYYSFVKFDSSLHYYWNLLSAILYCRYVLFRFALIPADNYGDSGLKHTATIDAL
jgi:hypothetical protein